MTTAYQYLKTQLERIKKSNLRIVNCLYVTLNPNDGSFRPCDNPDEIIQYINKESNHPPNLIKHLPTSIEKRLSNNYYEDTLNKAGYIHKVVYHAPNASNKENKNENRKRNAIWFNLPYNNSATARIGQSFLYLIDIHFLKKPHL